MRAILTYHSIDASGSPISCHPTAFAQHLAWFRSGRVQITTVDALLHLPPSADAVAITFDDGYTNFADVAAPLLARDAFPVTLFVAPGLVGTSNAWDQGPIANTPQLPLLDWPSLVRLRDTGVTLGGHGLTHRSLARLSRADLEAEVHGCAQQIAEHTGTRPAGFAYPYGLHDRASVEVVRHTFDWACSTEFQLLSSESSICTLPRLDMFYFQRPGSLEGWGSARFAAHVAARHLLRRVRRLARRRIS